MKKKHEKIDFSLYHFLSPLSFEILAFYSYFIVINFHFAVIFKCLSSYALPILTATVKFVKKSHYNLPICFNTNKYLKLSLQFLRK